MARWSLILLLVPLTAIALPPQVQAQAHPRESRSMPLSGGNSQTVLAEPEHPSSLGPLQPITKFQWDSSYAPRFAVWPTEVVVNKRHFRAGQRLPVMLVHCRVDGRSAKWTAHCTSGREDPPLHLFGNSRIDVREWNGPARLSGCFDVQIVAPDEAALREVEKQLAAQKSFPTDALSRDGRVVWATLELRSIRSTPVKVGMGPAAKTVIDRMELTSAEFQGWVPDLRAEEAALPLIVPIGKDGLPLAPVAKELMLGMSFPGRPQYVFRALRSLELKALPTALQAALTYDRAAMAFTSGDLESGARAVEELKRLLRGELPADLRTLIQNELWQLESLSSGERVLSDPCAAIEAAP